MINISVVYGYIYILTNKIKLTDIQQNILDNVKKGIIIDDGNRSNFQRVIEKIYKELNKN